MTITPVEATVSFLQATNTHDDLQEAYHIKSTSKYS